MGFTWEGGKSLADLYDPEPLDEALIRSANRIEDFLLERVKFHTPVGQPAPGQAMEEFTAERGGRVPGTLKESWEKGEQVLLALDSIIITVQTFDPIAPYVENPTRPHAIRGNPILRFRDSATGALRFAREVHHPGTEGSYMMAKALQETAVELEHIVREEISRAL